MKKQLFSALAAGLLIVPGFQAFAAPVYNPVTNHYYQLVDASVNWENANSQAQAMSYNGLSGHLVTITDALENIFLTDRFSAGALHYHWIGGYQAPNSVEPAGGWSWVTGETFDYQNWWPGEPNNWGRAEDRIVFDHGVTNYGKGWNDLNGNTFTKGYLVEFEGAGAPLPAPAAMVFLTGIVGLLGSFKRKK